MARQRRHTEPLETVHGTLVDYAEIDRYLLEGEYKGRTWIFERARTAPLLSTYDDHDIRELHRTMFGDLLDWAGQFRTTDVGPGGKVPVPWFQVPVTTRVFTDNLAVRVRALSDEPTLVDMAELVADAHHRPERLRRYYLDRISQLFEG